MKQQQQQQQIHLGVRKHMREPKHVKKKNNLRLPFLKLASLKDI